jgi:benzoyl-CoA-dihydrodiol lyase
VAQTSAPQAPISFQTSPECYRHWKLEPESAHGPGIAQLTMSVAPEGGLRPGYELKLNSYDLGVDIELCDALQRLRFEHPQVRCVVLTGGQDRVFCAGANIHMLGSSTHGFKVNFCKYTNETRLGFEDASLHSNKRFLAALNGTASGGGYELALACDRILLCDDRSSAVSFPELPLLGVLPGTGGLTRLVDKRMVRKDLADAFSSIAEGIKGKRAVEWRLVDRIAPLSRWKEAVGEMARELAAEVEPAAERGVQLEAVEATVLPRGRRYTHVALEIDAAGRRAELELVIPAEGARDAAQALAQGSRWWIFQAFRELDDALLHLRFNHPQVGLVMLRVKGSLEQALATDALLVAGDNWFVREVRSSVRRTLKRVENMSKSLYAVADEGTAFAGTFLELALACDRTYLLNDEEQPVRCALSGVHAGLYPMANGLTRLQTRFLGEPERVPAVLARAGAGPLSAEDVLELGLCTFAPDGIDWEDELRLAMEERASYSPDGLTGMEQNLRFPGPETLETKIFGRLSAWQNWIFQRPNAVGERGALKCYGTPKAPEFDYSRT